jgi:hypothetical protein
MNRIFHIIWWGILAALIMLIFILILTGIWLLSYWLGQHIAPDYPMYAAVVFAFVFTAFIVGAGIKWENP